MLSTCYYCQHVSCYLLVLQVFLYFTLLAIGEKMLQLFFLSRKLKTKTAAAIILKISLFKKPSLFLTSWLTYAYSKLFSQLMYFFIFQFA